MKPLQKRFTPNPTEFTPDITVPQLKDIVSYFPIGDRISYYPEYQADMTMQSLVLGYEINGHIIYTQNQLEIITGRDKEGFVILHLEEEREFSRIDSFCILLPGQAGEEYKLNFLNKAALGSRGQFRNGNAITLVARYQEQGVIVMESSVRESILPKDGYYRNHRLVKLDVIASSLEISEQRTHHRLQTNIPIKLQHNTKQQHYPCILGNYSEVSAQIRFSHDTEPSKHFKTGDQLTVTLKLDKLHRTFVIGGSVMRVNHDNLILTLQQILVDGKLKPFDLIDALDVKASLLQHPGSE